MGITVVGSLNFDLDTYTDRVPDSGETYSANHFETHAGGKGLNQAVSMSKLKDPNAGYCVRMVGHVGDDSFGESLLKVLRDTGVDVSQVGVVPGISSGIATILVEEQCHGQNRILIVSGANGKSVYTDSDLEKVFPEKHKKEAVILQHEIPNPPAIISWLYTNRPEYQVVFNPSPFQPLPKSLWAMVDILVVNELEAMQIVKTVYEPDEIETTEALVEANFINGYTAICTMFQETLVNQEKSAIIVITLGSKGVLFSSKENPTPSYVEAITDVPVVDTTGAGDTFLGGLVTQLYQDVDLEHAVKFSTRASSLTIQEKGAAESMPIFATVSSLM